MPVLGNIFKGTTEIDAIYIGTVSVNRVYHGTEQIWPHSTDPGDYTPAYQFNDARNSQYIPLVF